MIFLAIWTENINWPKVANITRLAHLRRGLSWRGHCAKNLGFQCSMNLKKRSRVFVSLSFHEEYEKTLPRFMRFLLSLFVLSFYFVTVSFSVRNIFFLSVKLFERIPVNRCSFVFSSPAKLIPSITGVPIYKRSLRLFLFANYTSFW